jgi:hypothetical protein
MADTSFLVEWWAAGVEADREARGMRPRKIDLGDPTGLAALMVVDACALGLQGRPRPYVVPGRGRLFGRGG